MSNRRKPRLAGKRRRPMRRIAQDHQPGTVSAKLRRQMGDAIADLFDDVGQDFYTDSVLGVKDTLKTLFEDKLGTLSSTVKEELGRRGLEESARHFQGFMNELVSDVIQYGMEDINATVEDLASTMAAQYGAEDEFAEEAGGELFEVEPGDVEEIEEVFEEDVEPVEEDEEDEEEGEEEAEGGEEGEEVTDEELDDLFGEGSARPDARRPRTRRPRSRRRQVEAREKGHPARRGRAQRLLRRLDR